jgi:hypothetical protein
MYNRGKIRWNEIIKNFILISWPFLFSCIIFFASRYAIRNGGWVEDYYSRGIYTFIARFLSSFSKLYSFSLWDCFWLIVIWLIVSGLILVIIRKLTFSKYFLRLLQMLALLYSLFYLSWGFNYFRPKIEERLDWGKPAADSTIFSSVLDSIISKTNWNHIVILSSDYPVIDRLVEKSYSRNSKLLGLDYPNGSRRPKTMIMSSIFLKLGVSGYFGPFFNEIHLNNYLLPIDYPFVLAHEKAHQFGITSEAEANLIAYIVCVTSGDQRLRYSGYQNLLLYFLRDAYRSKYYKKYIEKIDKFVLAELRFRQNYYNDLQSEKLSQMQNNVNDSYLKVNHIEKGIMDYNHVVSLVLSWYSNSSRSNP